MNYEKKFDVADVVHAIREHQEVKQPLIRVLELGAVERNDALKKLAFSMKETGAPQSLVDVILGLQQTSLAQGVLQELQGELPASTFWQKVKSSLGFS